MAFLFTYLDPMHLMYQGLESSQLIFAATSLKEKCLFKIWQLLKFFGYFITFIMYTVPDTMCTNTEVLRDLKVNLLIFLLELLEL